MRLNTPLPIRLAVLAPLATAVLMACGGGGGGGFAALPTPAPPPVDTACAETGPYACKTGETEPLYTFQWALNYAKSWFTDNADAGAYGGGIDLNVEPVHRQGYKGQGVNVLVVDSGVDLAHEDLRENTDIGMSWNFETDMPDPHPLLTTNGSDSAHGTNVAGIIGAAQNGKGVMGIAPRVRIGGAAIVTRNDDIWTQANFASIFGGAPWSRDVHVINGSYGAGTRAVVPYTLSQSAELAGIRGLKSLRDGNGIVFVKAAGNYFGTNRNRDCGPLTGAYDCVNPGNDSTTLEPNVIVTAALNAKGQASAYSSAGSVVWITGMAGESGRLGRYGEVSGLNDADVATGATGDGPTIFSTDTSGCAEGYSRHDTEGAFTSGKSERVPGVADNPNCDYGHMNGTSSASPTIAAVTALMLSANPALTWRDVRDILRLSARQVDMGYEQRIRKDVFAPRTLPYNALFDLRTNSFVPQTGGAQDIVDGATQVPVELGWVSNGAGLRYANWYGFGVPDAAKAVELALLYKKEPERSRSATQIIPSFKPVAEITQLKYQQAQLIGTFVASEKVVDQLQLRVSGKEVCLGSMGLVVESPAGTKSWLKLPLDHFALWPDAPNQFSQYGAGSYAFYGESAQGPWKVYAVMSNPSLPHHELNITTCEAAPDDGETENPNAKLLLEARIIAQ